VVFSRCGCAAVLSNLSPAMWVKFQLVVRMLRPSLD
jgi:hypothetical protein